MTTQVTVWERGKGKQPPADLVSGRYSLTFASNWTAIIIVRQAVELLLNKRLPFTGGHSLRLLSVTTVPFTDNSGIMLLDLQIEGMPWAILAGLGLILGLGIGIFGYLSLTKVVRIFELLGGTFSSILLMLALVAAVGFGGYALVKSR